MKDFAGDTCGATAIEYAIVGSLISIMIVAGASAIGVTVKGFFNAVSGSVK